LASSQFDCAPLRAESQDSERTVGEVAMGETWAPDDRAARESPTSEVTVTVAVDPSKEVAGASTA
jgi:hypothetical protein